MNIFYVFFGAILQFVFFIILGKYIYDWYNETEKRNRMAEAQVRLLALIAASQGVNVDTIANIVAESKANFKPAADKSQPVNSTQ